MKFHSLRLAHYQHIRAQLQRKLSRNLVSISRIMGEALAEFAEHIEARPAKTALNFALDLLRPRLSSLGLRMAKFSSEQIEVVIPRKVLNQDANEELEEGSLVSASIFAVRKLWKKNAPKGHLEIQFNRCEFERLRPLKGEMRLRLQLSVLNREAVFAELAENRWCKNQSTVQVFDDQDQMVAKVMIEAELSMQKTIGWST